MTVCHDHCGYSKDGKEIGFLFARFYDQYTKYRRDHAIYGECLPYNQFIKQLKKSDLFIAYKSFRIGGGTPICIAAIQEVFPDSMFQMLDTSIHTDGKHLAPGKA